jgi:hypothetical protein
MGRLTQAARDRMDKAAPIIGVMDTRYEEFILLCLLGGAVGLGRSSRAGWIVAASVIFIHVVVSSYLGGVWTRYTVPVLPLLYLGGAYAGAGALALSWSALSRIWGRLAATATIQESLAPVR